MRTLAAEAVVRESARRWAGFAMMCVGMFMAILDVQVVATSLPTIQKALGMAAEQMSWVQTAYLIAEVVAIPLTGLLTRALSMRWLFVSAVCLFTVASCGCALSDSFTSLIAWRTIQGFSGGSLIPLVFAAVFILFPEPRQGIATTIAGLLAVLAPTLGPFVGGWTTERFSWHWLFLINVVPGFVAGFTAAILLPRDPPHWRDLRKLDAVSLASMAAALALLVIALKEAPDRGWASGTVALLFAGSFCTAVLFIVRTWRASHPVVDLHSLRDPQFGIACLLSLVLGMGLFGMIYLLPVFLAEVRNHGAFAIGRIMLVTGAAQMITAPLAVALERRADSRVLAGVGFLLFAGGLGMSAFQSTSTDYDEMFWPQILRGCAIMLCLLAPTRMALGDMDLSKVPDASGLFNVMRNIGGAIGLALVDTVIYGRGPVLGQRIADRLLAGDEDVARKLGLPVRPAASALEAITPGLRAIVEPLIRRQALVEAINEAWMMLAIISAVAVGSLLLVRRPGGQALERRTDPADL